MAQDNYMQGTSEKQFWENHMVAFTSLTPSQMVDEYMKISRLPDRFCTASQAYPILAQNGQSTGNYDFLVWYKQRPAPKPAVVQPMPTSTQSNVLNTPHGQIQLNMKPLGQV